MRSLAFMSFLGLMAFIAFSNFSHADVYQEEQQSDCEQYNDCEQYQEEYEAEEDRDVIINNNIIINGQQQQVYRPPIATVPQVVPVPVYPVQPMGRPLCQIIVRGGWAELWIGQRAIQSGPFGVIRNSAWYYVRTGQCVKGFPY